MLQPKATIGSQGYPVHPSHILAGKRSDNSRYLLRGSLLIRERTLGSWGNCPLKAAFFLAQQAFPHLELTRGNIINVSSTNAIRPASRNQLYDSLKAALNNLTQGLALDFRDSGVRVNAVMPGGVRTALSEEWLHKYLGRAPVKADFDIPSLAPHVQSQQLWGCQSVLSIAQVKALSCL